MTTEQCPACCCNNCPGSVFCFPAIVLYIPSIHSIFNFPKVWYYCEPPACVQPPEERGWQSSMDLLISTWSCQQQQSRGRGRELRLGQRSKGGNKLLKGWAFLPGGCREKTFTKLCGDVLWASTLMSLMDKHKVKRQRLDRIFEGWTFQFLMLTVLILWNTDISEDWNFCFGHSMYF